jgi:carbamate kinase
MNSNVAVVAIGGNSLIKDRMHQTVRDQYIAASETCEHIAAMVQKGWTVAVTHGNGPQVGFMLRRSELAAHELHEVPLDACGADTQGALGYALQQNLYNHFRRLNIRRPVVTIVTQVEVSPDDPAFQNPSKPIGSFMDEDQAALRRAQGWQVFEDAGRGWRRVVPSPQPVRIIEEPVIKDLIDGGTIVIAVGGGGIPVVAGADGNLSGVAAVIDKDYASALLAIALKADLFLISTSVERVALNYRRPDQVWLDRLTLAQAKRYLAEGSHFAGGSMAPKIQAAVNYLEQGGNEVIITTPDKMERALEGETGTRIVKA